MLSFELGYKAVPGKRPSEGWMISDRFHAHRPCAIVEFELHLVPGTDTEAVAEFFRNDYLPLWSDPVSHTM